MVGLKNALKLRDGQKIYLECLYDVSDGKTHQQKGTFS
jgi:hypothetical protein